MRRKEIRGEKGVRTEEISLRRKEKYEIREEIRKEKGGI